MTPFLKLVADDLYQKLGGNFQDTCIIFPNKRASLFFNEYLWSNSEGQTMWTPEYTTISELFAELSEHTVGDSIYLIVKLWEVYKEKMQPTKTLDQLYSLMETMLSDFQDIDNNLVEPSKLFLNIADLKEMTDFSFLEDEQREAIEQFFGQSTHWGIYESQPETLLKSKFINLWNRLEDIYEAYQEALLTIPEGKEPMVYEGMLKRKVIEVLTDKDEEMRKRTDARLVAKTYVMVGFNVLNKTERELFRYIKQHRDTKFYWDYDITYTKSSKGDGKVLSKYEAGQFILENIRLLGDEFEGKDLFNNMRSLKDITFIQSPTENAQARYIDKWVKNIISNDKRSALNPQASSLAWRNSAVILCNENLLQPVLHSIDKVPAINVTMGYPLTETPINSLVQTLLELQVHGRTSSGAWRYKYVAAVLKHAFIQKLIGKACNEKLLEFSKDNVVFPGMERFADNPIMQRIFTPVTGKQLTTYLSEIISMVGHSYQGTNDQKDFTLQIYKESIFKAYTIVNRIHTLQQGLSALTVSDETLSRLIRQLMSQATIPFHGEPAVGLQVMGLLETRNLDFRNVIMLSVNEGQIPKGVKRSSLIPYTLRAAYGMTTIEREVSLYAYYYYRLLQRAENITLLYNSSTDSGNKGEMSRFMLQTLAEKDDLFSPNQEIALRAFTVYNETKAVSPISIKKDADVMEKLYARFNKEHILSPSAINTYMKCPLKFYLNYVAGLRPEDEVSDDIDKPMFGNIFHDTMHHLYLPYERKPFHSSEVRALAADDARVTYELNQSFAHILFHSDKLPTLNGTQLINRHVIKKFILNQLQADAMMAEELEKQGGYWLILTQEYKYTTGYQLATLNHQLLLGGFVDRLDLLHTPTSDRIRIVDYKTSSKPHGAKTVEELFDPDKCAGNYHIMQTLYYCKVLTDPNCQPSVLDPELTLIDSTPSTVPALMYCAKEYGANYSGIVKLAPADGNKREEITDYKTQYGELYDDLLSQKITEIFTPYEEDAPNGTFSQCTDDKNCAYCDFLSFCQRHPAINKW